MASKCVTDTGVAGGSGVQTRIITSIAAIGQSPIPPSVAISSTPASVVSMGTASVATVTTGTPIHLTQHQQTLLARVESQLKVLAANPSRTPEQERFLHLLVNAQQQIRAQGRSQLHAALTGSKTSTSSAAVVSVSTTTPTIATASK